MQSKFISRASDCVTSTIGKYRQLREVDPGEYRKLKMNILMKFDVHQYEVEGIGNLAIMTINVGVMKMMSMVLTPVWRDLPLVSVDFAIFGAKRMLYVELFDLVVDKSEQNRELADKLGQMEARYQKLVDVGLEPAWYDDLRLFSLVKNGKAADDDRLFNLMSETLDLVCQAGEKEPALDGEDLMRKRELVQTYPDGLLEHGGVSTDAFIDSLGKDKTRDFFEKVLFKIA